MLAAPRDRLVQASRALAREGLVVGSVGNLSLRVPEGVLITPTRVPYEAMTVSDLVAVHPSGERLGGRHEPSRELPLHLAVYERRTEVGALVHTHSPYAAAWSFLGEPLLPLTEENEYYGIGEVRTSPPCRAGSPQLAERVSACLGDSAAVLIGRHGLLAAATDLPAALDVARVVERQAQIAWILRGGSAAPGAGERPR